MDEYLYKMDLPQTENAIRYAGFPQEIVDDIWVIKRIPFEVF